MLVNDIFDLARNNTHTTAAQYPNATLLTWLNIEYKKLVRWIITEATENYFDTYQEIDAVADQSSYTFATNVVAVKMVKVKPTSTSTDYVMSREVDFSKQEHDYEYFANNQPTNEVLHQIIGGALWIAPRFVTATTGSVGNKQIYVEYEKRQSDLAVGGVESTISIPVDYHDVLAAALTPYIFKGLGKINEKNDAVIEFNNMKDNMLYNLRGRDQTRNNFSIPNDDLLQ